VLDELAAKDANDAKAFDKAFFGHIGLIFGNAARAFTLGFGLGKPAVPFSAPASVYAQDIARLSAGFGLCADAAMASLGSALKKREMLSARLGDVLSNLYLASMVLKQWEAGDKVEGEEALLHFSCRFLLQRVEQAFVEIFDNLPNRTLGKTLKLIVMPTGRRWNKPHDDLARDIAKRVSTHSALRTHLLANTWDKDDGAQPNPLATYNTLLAEYDRAEALYRTLNKAYAKGELPTTALHPEQRVEAGLEKGLISEEDAQFMRDFEAQVLELLTVDDFAYDELASDKDKVIYHNAPLAGHQAPADSEHTTH
jgi:acyl-CoA dehydrogenase